MATVDKAFLIKDDLVVHSAPGRQFVIPVGRTNERPGEGAYPAPITGTLRFNTDIQVVEVWNGVVWQAASQVGESVTKDEANEISIVNAIIFG